MTTKKNKDPILLWLHDSMKITGAFFALIILMWSLKYLIALTGDDEYLKQAEFILNFTKTTGFVIIIFLSFIDFTLKILNYYNEKIVQEIKYFIKILKVMRKKSKVQEKNKLKKVKKIFSKDFK